MLTPATPTIAGFTTRNRPQDTHQSRFNVIDKGCVDEEIERCEVNYDGFDDLKEVQVQMQDSHKTKRLFM